MDHFSRPDDELAVAQRNGTLQRNFQGYSTRAECDLVALGVTSIGKICDNYSQNTRDVEEYYRRVASGRLPIDRGFELETDDLLRREIITGLMCHFRLDIHSLEERWGIVFRNRFRDEITDLRQMENDGLLELDEDTLQVLPTGRLLVRNICMVFDRYLRESGKHNRYSKVI
jgi:oxygen-independent coproporphyrinogen-3 oxidase